MHLSTAILLEIEKEPLVWNRQLAPEFQLDLKSGWVDFELKDCGTSIAPTKIKVWDNEDGEVVCSETCLDKIFNLIIQNTEICQ